jgi:hypothetical protein
MPGWPAPPPWRAALPVAAVGLIAASLIVAHRSGLPQQFDPLAPFVVGTGWGMDHALAAQGVVIRSGPSEIGYDGQWFLGQAYDPLLRGEVAATFDAPRYRALRGLLPAAGWLLAAGQPAAIPYALLALLILAVGAGCAGCARVISAHGRSRWWGLGFAAVPGTVVGVAYGTAEPLGLALAVLGLSLLFDRRPGWAGLAFAGAALTKENYLAFGLIAGLYLAVDSYLAGRNPLRASLLVAGPGLIGLAGWWWYVARALPPDAGAERALVVFAPPPLGWWETLGLIVRGDYPEQALWWGWAVLVGTLGLLLVALARAVTRRRSVLAYPAVLWSGYGLSLSGLLLGRFLSAQRALAPAVLAAGVFLIAAGLARRTGAPAPAPPAAAPPLAAPPAAAPLD